MFALAVLSIALFVAQAEWLEHVRDERYNGVDAAMLDLALTGGTVDTLGELGMHWGVERPGKAGVMLRAAAARSQWPIYQLLLAKILGARSGEEDRQEARGFLQVAQAGLAQWDEIDEWTEVTVDDARKLLGLPKKVW